MAGRGLNKGRGLSALIPQKNKKSPGPDEKVDIKQKPAEKASGDAREKEQPKPAKKGATPTSEKKTTEKENKTPTSEAISAANSTNPATGILRVRLSEVVPSRTQPRKIFEEEPIRELAESIKEHGVITPLLVRKKGNYYELIAGERRWRAAKLAGLKDVPVLLRDFSEQEAMEIALIDNLQREDLNPIEEAHAYQSLIDEFHFRQEEVAQRVSKSRSAIANALRLLKLEESVQTMLIAGSLTMGHARALLGLESPELQRITAERVKASGLSVRDTEKLVRQLLQPRTRTAKKQPDPQIAAVYADLEEQLRKALGTRVSISPLRGKKGKVEIEYYSNEDLERILDRLRR